MCSEHPFAWKGKEVRHPGPAYRKGARLPTGNRRRRWRVAATRISRPDGVQYFNLRLEDTANARQCILVLNGATSFADVIKGETFEDGIRKQAA